MHSKEAIRTKIITLLKEDEEFRYIVSGLIGLQEILKRLEELSMRLEEQGKRLEELSMRLEEQGKRLEELSMRLEEQGKRLEELSMRLEEQGKRLEELSMRLEEQGKRLEELTTSMAEVKVALGSLGRRWGKDLEKTVLAIYKHALEERGIKPGMVEKFKYRDVDGRYLKKGSDIELDVYIHNDKLYLIEVKSRAEADHVTWLTVKAPIVEEILGRKAEKIILVAVNIDKEAYQYAKQQGIEVIAGSIIE